jgi:phosphoribosylpyrophosphate synthetase
MNTTPAQEFIRAKKLEDLEDSLKDREDPITWRSLSMSLRSALESPEPENIPPPPSSYPEAEKLIDKLTEGTYFNPLKWEILWSIYGEYGEDKILPPKEKIEPLDTLLINCRHKAEDKLFWDLADYLNGQGKSVGVLIPVGHYNDGQTRIVVPDLLVRPVRTAVFMTSTQAQDGGDISVLNLTLRALRNPNFSYMIDRVVILVPMFGGSRGHTWGQAPTTGFEILETIYDAKLLINTLDDIRKSITTHEIYKIYKHVLSSRGNLTFPSEILIATADIHNQILPARKFNDETNYRFVSILASKEQAEKTLEALSETKYKNLPKRIVACDAGSIERTENYATQLLKLNGGEVEIVYIEKQRIRAGEVAGCFIKRIVSCHLDKNANLVKTPVSEGGMKKECVIIYVDDMIDTGGTAARDISEVRHLFPHSKYVIFVATHPIFSAGVKEAIGKIGADRYILGDSLSTKRFKGIKNIMVAGLAPSIARGLNLI